MQMLNFKARFSQRWANFAEDFIYLRPSYIEATPRLRPFSAYRAKLERRWSEATLELLRPLAASLRNVKNEASKRPIQPRDRGCASVRDKSLRQPPLSERMKAKRPRDCSCDRSEMRRGVKGCHEVAGYVSN